MHPDYCQVKSVPRNHFATIPICCLANDFYFVPGSDVEWTSSINRPSLPAPICKWFDPLASQPLQQVFLIIVFRRCISTGILGPDFFSILSKIHHNRSSWYFWAFQFLLDFSKLLLLVCVVEDYGRAIWILTACQKTLMFEQMVLMITMMMNYDDGGGEVTMITMMMNWRCW